MKTYNQPTVDFLTLEVKNDICVAFGTNAASPEPTGPSIQINPSGAQVVSD